jgi:pre-mRNA-processing factor 40
MNHGREKDRGREREKEDHLKKDAADNELVETTEIYVSGENRRSGKDKDKKNRKRHQSSQDNLIETEKDRSKNSHRHSSDRKKSRRVCCFLPSLCERWLRSNLCWFLSF